MAEAAKMKNGRLTETLRENDRVVITEGPHAGSHGRVINPLAVPDGDINQRKVNILLEDEAFELYILPRQLRLAEQQATITSINAHKEEAPIMATAAMTDNTPATKSSPEVETVPFETQMEIEDPMHPALDFYRPDPSIVDDYVSRTVEGYKDIELLLHLRDDRDEDEPRPNVALVGATQTGKTMLMQVLAVEAAKRDGLPKPYPLFTLNGSAGISNYDLYGKTTAVIIDGKEVLVWMDGVVPLAARCGGFLYLDEWNAVPPTQAVGLHSILDDRRQFTNTHRAVPNGAGGYLPEVVKANSNLWVVATINPLGYKGTQAMAEATSNRFRWIPWDYDTDVEKEMIPSEAVRDFLFLLRQAHEMGKLKTPVGTSAAYRLNLDLATYGAGFALMTFKAMFQTKSDLIQVEEIIELNSIEDRLDNEYEGRSFEPS